MVSGQTAAGTQAGMRELGAHGAFYRLARFAALGAACLTLANCSGGPGKIDPKYGVAASERVVSVGERAPKAFAGANDPPCLTLNSHGVPSDTASGAGRMVAISSATFMPNLRISERFIIVPFSIRYIQSVTSSTCPPASLGRRMR